MSELVAKNRKNRLVPMCWKCQHGLWAKNKSESDVAIQRLNPQIFMGCSQDNRVNWDNRNNFCPLVTAAESK